jgi:CDP-diglyceride synthetase
MEIVKLIISGILAPLLLYLFKKLMEERSTSKLYNLKPDSEDGYFYTFWIGITFMINIIVFGFSILIFNNLMDISDPDKLNIEAYAFSVMLNIYILYLIYVFFNKVKKQFLNRKFFNLCYSYLLLFLPSLLITTLLYFDKIINNTIVLIIVPTLTAVICLLGLLNFQKRYDIYPCSLVNIKLNDGSKIRKIECKDIKVTSKWLIIQKDSVKIFSQIVFKPLGSR